MSSLYLYNMGSKSSELLTVRMDTETYLEFQAACKLRGASMSSIVHQYAVSVIYEEKGKHSERWSVEVEEHREKLRLKREAEKLKKAKRLPKSKPEQMPVYEMVDIRPLGDVARETGVDLVTVKKIIIGNDKDIPPAIVKIVLDAARVKTDNKVTPIKEKLANGNR